MHCAHTWLISYASLQPVNTLTVIAPSNADLYPNVCDFYLGSVYILTFKAPQNQHLVNFPVKLFQELSWRYIYQKPGGLPRDPRMRKQNANAARYTLYEEGKKAKIKTNCQQGKRGKHLITHSSSHALSRQSQ